MEKIFARANEKFVKAVVLYPNTSNVLCFDSEATDKVPGAILENLFKKNLVLVHTTGGDLRPTVFKKESTYYTVTAIKMGASSAEAATFKSDTLPA